MKIKLLAILITCSTCLSLNGQDLAFYCDVMIRADEPAHRNFAHQKFDSLFAVTLQKQGSYDNKFESLKWISVVYPSDSTFRIMTWQIDLGQGSYTYHGYLQTKEGRIEKIDDKWGSDALDLNTSISWNKWSGALVYDILGETGNYQILTFRFQDQFSKVKTCEPLVINTNSITLGSPIFQESEGSANYVNRIVLQYSSDANATLTYEPKSKRYVYDNLMTVMGRLEGQGVTQVPDGSYKAYEYNITEWKAIDKLFTQGNDAAPRGSKKTNRDLFGRSKG